MSSTTLLSLNNLSVWYTAGHPVLSDFSLDLGAKEVVGLIGLNGAGKTTFIKTVAGLLPGYHLDSAAWEGHSFSFRDKSFKRCRYIVFAEDRSFQYFTFREYLSYVASSYDVPLPDVSELIKGFHFEDYTDVLLKELSTGNLKKAYLITAFALRPKLLLLDEPVNGLDFQSTEFLYHLKCHLESIVRVLDNSGQHTSGNNIYTTTMTLFGKILVIRYVYCDCGYVENWVENKHELDEIKRTFG